MTIELLVQIAAVVLSLALAYVPKWREKYDQLDSAGKARVMALLLVAGTLAIFGLACANWLVFLGLSIACTAQDAVLLFRLLLTALIANQASYFLLVRPWKKPPGDPYRFATRG